MTRIRWSTALDDRVAAMRSNGATITEIAAEMDTSPRSIRSRIERLGRENVDAGRTEWTPEMLSRLRQLRSEGVRIDQIAKALSVSYGAIAAQSTRMALCDRNLPGPEIDAIVELAKEGATASRIARRHRIDEAAVLSVLTRHGITARTLPQSYRGPDRMRASR